MEPSMPMQPNELQITDQHIAVTMNAVLQQMATVLGNQQVDHFNKTKFLAPYAQMFAQLHAALMQSKQHQLEASRPENDPRFEQMLAQQEQQHKHALDLMAQHHEQQSNQNKAMLEEQKAQHDMRLAAQRHEAEQQMAGIQQLMQILQMQRDQENHSQQAQQAQEQHEQTLSNTDEMHQAQLQQALQPPAESGSEN